MSDHDPVREPSLALAGTVAIVVAACSAVDRDPRTAAPRPAGRAPSARPRARHPSPTPLVTAGARSTRACPAPTAASSSAGSSAWARAASRSRSRRRRTSSPSSTTTRRRTVYISLEIYDNKVAANILKTQIAAGNAPDIIGPVGVEGLNLFIDQLADLQPLDRFDRLRHEQVPGRDRSDFFKIGKGGADDRRAVRRPTRRSSGTTRSCSTRPSCRTRRPRSATCTRASRGTWTPSATLGMKLTVDKNGNDATSADFDPTNIVQWGFDSQYDDNSPDGRDRRCSAPARSLADDGKTAQIPDSMRTGEKWFNDGVWKDHFIPTQNQVNSDLLGKGSEFASGNLAMNEVHTWFTCCVNPAAPAKPIVGDNFGWAVAPSYNGDDHRQAACRHVQHAQDHQAPGRGVRGPVRARRLRRAGDHLRRHAGRSGPAAGLHRLGQRRRTRRRSSTGPSPRPCSSYPDIPNHQAWVPDYAKSQGRLAGVPEQVPDHARASTSTPSSTP